MKLLVKLTSLFAFIYIIKGWQFGPRARLLNEIKQSQSVNDIPVSQNGDPVDLQMIVYPVNIFDINPVSKTISLNAWLVVDWNSTLTWSPKEFGGVDQTTVPYSYMWMPGFFSATNAFDKLENEIIDYLFVHSSGLVKWHSRYTFRSFCDFDEDQLASNVTCDLTFSTLYMSSSVKFADRGDRSVDMNYYFLGSEYEILSTSFSTFLGRYDGIADHGMSQALFKFSFKRKNNK